ncbi:MAG: GNAT family N-acetyltransferase [Dehalococcoidia bacterium]|nr:GNAT family N-acetyltransferase [Dehalococcoidia bacterium]
MSDLIRAALATNAANLSLGSEVSRADNATFVRNPSHPIIYDANHVRDVTASTPEQIERLLVRVEREYAHAHHRRFDVDFRTPPEFSARLALEGYERNDELVMLLDGAPAGSPGDCDIRPVETQQDWAVYEYLRGRDWQDYASRHNRPPEPQVAASLFALARFRQPPVRHWIAYLEGEPAAYLSSWEGAGGVGQVEDLFALPQFRHRGLATALIHHCVADCRRHGAGPVAIVADAADTPKQMYAAIGFRPLTVVSHWLKRLPPVGNPSS